MPTGNSNHFTTFIEWFGAELIANIVTEMKSKYIDKYLKCQRICFFLLYLNTVKLNCASL